MKFNKFVPLTLFIVMLMVFAPALPTQADYADGVSDHCTSPTEFRTVTAAPSGNDTDFSFDTTELNVPEDTCFELTFINKAPTQAHDFTIDSNPGSDGISFVYIPIANATAGEYNNGTETFNIQTNSGNIFTFYSSVGTDQEQGMEGTLIVGDGTSGFLSINPLISLGVISLFAVAVLRNKRA